MRMIRPPVRRTVGWNQKFLDYEIETSIPWTRATVGFLLKSKVSRLRDWNRLLKVSDWVALFVEIKSFSITRLKLDAAPHAEAP